MQEFKVKRGFPARLPRAKLNRLEVVDWTYQPALPLFVISAFAYSIVILGVSVNIYQDLGPVFLLLAVGLILGGSWVLLWGVSLCLEYSVLTIGRGDAVEFRQRAGFRAPTSDSYQSGDCSLSVCPCELIKNGNRVQKKEAWALRLSSAEPPVGERLDVVLSCGYSRDAIDSDARVVERLLGRQCGKAGELVRVFVLA